ncbi:carboxypeptidase-like regulatory domain-containing protein [Sinomicrobium sp. M5D2P9]
MKYCYMIFIFLSFLSCNKDVQDITVQGIVENANTDEPIKNVDVTIICWKYGNSPDQSYSENETKTVTTDNEGKYKVSFDKGAFVEVKVSLDGYADGHETKEIYQKKSTVNISLKKE